MGKNGRSLKLSKGLTARCTGRYIIKIHPLPITKFRLRGKDVRSLKLPKGLTQ
jgi:hypothetical protein